MRTVFLAGLLAATPLSAQSLPQSTPAQDLDCALWASYTLGSIGDTGDQDVVAGLTMAVAWFTGLYEGKTGNTINAALEARSEMLTDADVQAMTDNCVARLTAFSERLQAFGE